MQMDCDPGVEHPRPRGDAAGGSGVQAVRQSGGDRTRNRLGKGGDGLRGGGAPRRDGQQGVADPDASVDGLSVQVALDDPRVDAKRAKRIAMDFARRALTLSG